MKQLLIWSMAISVFGTLYALPHGPRKKDSSIDLDLRRSLGADLLKSEHEEQKRNPIVKQNQGKYAIVIGASSGIGRGLALKLSEAGYIVGAVARRIQLLETLEQEAKNPIFIKQVDIADHEAAAQQIQELITQMGGYIDVAIINAAIWPELDYESKLVWQAQQATIAVNVTGCTRLMTLFAQQFVDQQAGHLVTISSVDALRGSAMAPMYAATKAFLSNYADGLRYYFTQNKLPITVTDVLPGYVEVPEFQLWDSAYWVTPYEKAVNQIIQEAVIEKKKCIYVSHRWKIIAALLLFAPDWLNDALGVF